MKHFSEAQSKQQQAINWFIYDQNYFSTSIIYFTLHGGWNQLKEKVNVSTIDHHDIINLNQAIFCCERTLVLEFRTERKLFGSPVDIFQVSRRWNHLTTTALQRLRIEGSNSSTTCFSFFQNLLHLSSIEFPKILSWTVQLRVLPSIDVWTGCLQ